MSCSPRLAILSSGVLAGRKLKSRLVKRGQLAASRLGIIPDMKSDAKRVLKVTKAKPSKEYANLLRQLWKEGHERVTASILETRKVEKERGKSPL
jgi:hypothetical protein